MLDNTDSRDSPCGTSRFRPLTTTKLRFEQSSSTIAPGFVSTLCNSASDTYESRLGEQPASPSIRMANASDAPGAQEGAGLVRNRVIVAASAACPPQVRRTPGISCEAVRTAAKRRNARGGTAVRLPGAATSFVCFIPLFDGSALPGFTQDSTMPLRTTILAPAPSAAGTSEDPGVARRLPQLARAVTPPPCVMHRCHDC